MTTSYTTRTKPSVSWNQNRESLWSADNLPWASDYLPWVDSDTTISTSWTSRTEPTTNWTNRVKP